MHVLLLAKSFPHIFEPGAVVFVTEQAVALQKKGVKTGLVAAVFISWKHLLKFRFSIFGLKKFDYNGVHVIIRRTPVFPFAKKINHKRRDRILRKLTDEYMKDHGQPDICHIHGFYCGHEAIRLKKTYGIPLITTEHYSVFAREMLNKQELERAENLYAESAVRIAVSLEFKDLLEKKFKLEFQCLPNIVDVDKFVPHPNTADSKGFVILNVGSLDSNKNQALLLEALAKLPEEFSLIIAGKGPEKKRLIEQANNLGIQQRVKFIGFIPHDRLVALFQNSDVLAVTSRYETFGVVMIEAMSCGIPVVSTPVGVATWLINDERLGYITDYEADKIAFAIQNVKSNQQDRSFIRNFAVSNFSSDMISQKLIQIYNSIIRHE
jgi:L-malate glycosyltransferase